MRLKWSQLLGTWVVLSLGFALILGCGGSTTGTGGVAVLGKVLSSSGQPISNVAVTVSNTGDSTTTDSNGDFAVSTDSSDHYDLLFETNNRSIKGSITSVPSKATQVKAVFTIKDDSDEADETDIEFKEHTSHAATPTPTRTPYSSSATPKPTTPAVSGGSSSPSSNGSTDNSSSSSSDSPEVTPTVTPTIIATPTATPSATSTPAPTRTPEASEKEQIGRITSIQGNLLMLGSSTFQVTSHTEIAKEGTHNATISDLHVGDKIHIHGRSNGDIYNATEIEVLSSRD